MKIIFFFSNKEHFDSLPGNPIRLFSFRNIFFIILVLSHIFHSGHNSRFIFKQNNKNFRGFENFRISEFRNFDSEIWFKSFYWLMSSKNRETVQRKSSILYQYNKWTSWQPRSMDFRMLLILLLLKTFWVLLIVLLLSSFCLFIVLLLVSLLLAIRVSGSSLMLLQATLVSSFNGCNWIQQNNKYC